MKKSTNFIFSKLTAVALFIALGSIFLFSSCEKDETGTLVINSGTPSITNIFYLDTATRRKDSAIVSAEPFKLIIIQGLNLGGAKALYFNGFKTDFNVAYNTNENLIVRVPSAAPTDSVGIGSKFNKIILVTVNGETSTKFQIIAKPAVYETDKVTFGVDRGDITFKGKNFANVSKVVFTGTTTAVNIVARTKDKIGNETMTLRFPTEAKLGQVTLDITNSSGTITTTNFEFVNADVALKIFTEGFDQDWTNNAWGDAGIVNSEQAFAGKRSMSQKLNGGAYHLIGFNNYFPSVLYSSEYTHITFAVKGGAVDTPFWIESDASSAGFGQKYLAKNAITVPAKVWTFYKIALKDLDFWSPGKTLKQIAWQVKGVPATSDIYYFDDVMLVRKN